MHCTFQKNTVQGALVLPPLMSAQIVPKPDKEVVSNLKDCICHTQMIPVGNKNLQPSKKCSCLHSNFAKLRFVV